MFGGETRILSTTDRGNTGVRGLTDPAFSSGVTECHSPHFIERPLAYRSIDLCYASLYFLFICFCLRYLQDRPAVPIVTKSSRWQMGCNRPVKLWFLGFWTLSAVERRFKKCHFRSILRITKCNVAAKRIYLSKKRKLSDKTAWKPVERRPRSFGAFSANTNTEVLDSQRCYSSSSWINQVLLFSLLHIINQSMSFGNCGAPWATTALRGRGRADPHL